MNEQALIPDKLDATDPNLLDLRDIHLPDPVSWWPLAPGWWMALAAVLLIIAVIVIARKIYQGRQLRRDISAELELIKLQYQQTGNRSQLARSLSVLLRRANISYYPKTNIAGLTGRHWLEHLDMTNSNRSTDISFQSSTGEVLLNAPYLPEDSKLDFDAQTLIALCESWLMSTHSETQVHQS
jgi:hypothetical protein